MTTTPSETPEDAPKIYAEIYESQRLFKWRWRFRFIGDNGEKIGDDYDNFDDARHAVDLLVKPRTQVVLRIRHRTGVVETVGRIR